MLKVEDCLLCNLFGLKLTCVCFLSSERFAMWYTRGDGNVSSVGFALAATDAFFLRFSGVHCALSLEA